MIAKKIPREAKGRTAATQIAALVSYIFAGGRDDPNDKLIAGGTMNMFADSPKAAIAEMIALGMACPKSKMPVSHWVLSWKTGEAPTVDQVRKAVSMFVNDIGFAGHQIAWGLHGNTGNLHVHVAINRINPDTERVVKPNKGFDRLAAQRAITRIERAQGWEPERGAKYGIDGDGNVCRKSELRGVNADANPVDAATFRPGYRAKAVEIHQGVKSAQRVGHEKLSGILKNVKSWGDLHAMFAYAGATYEPFGGGAVIKMNGVTIKASDLQASPKKLSKRLGPFQPCPPEFVSAAANAPSAPPVPIDDDAVAYQQERGAWNAARKKTLTECDTRADERRNALKARHDAERDDALRGSWRGRGNERNALESALADKREREHAELKAEIKRERAELRERYPDFQDFNEWLKRRSECAATETEGVTSMVEVQRHLTESVLVALATRQATDRDKLSEKILSALAEGRTTSEKARDVVNKLRDAHLARIVSVGDSERGRLDTDYKERREAILNNGSWKDRGAERNALSKALAERHGEDRAASLLAQRAAVAAARRASEEMHAAVDRITAPTPRAPDAPEPVIAPTRRDAEPKKVARPSLTHDDFRKIKQIDPSNWLQCERGYAILRSNPNRFSVLSGKDDVYRCDRNRSGDWITFLKTGECIGNNIQLAKHEADVRDLLDVGAIFGVYSSGYTPRGEAHTSPSLPRPTEPVEETRFSPPPAATAEQRGDARRYLIDQRAIPIEVIEQAERAGFLIYTGAHVVFPGYDASGAMRGAQVRAWDQSPGVLQKGALKGSRLAFPAILPGDDASTVVIAESGISSLSVAALAREAGEPAPTIISTGGSGSWRWIDEETSPARAAILTASRVIIAAENEDSAEKQADKDNQRAEMARRIAAATGRDPDILYPPSVAGDANDICVETGCGSGPVSTWSDSPTRWAPASPSPSL